MKRLSAGIVATLLLTNAPAIGAQTKTLPGEMVTATATVEAIQQATRTITLKEIDDLVPRGARASDDLFLHIESAVVCGDAHIHMRSFSPTRRRPASRSS